LPPDLVWEKESLPFPLQKKSSRYAKPNSYECYIRRIFATQDDKIYEIESPAAYSDK